MIFNYHKKYLELYINNEDITPFENPPKLYLDFYKSKPLLRFYYKDSKKFTLHLGLFSFHFMLLLNWGHVERPMNEEEKELKSRLDSFNKDLEKKDVN